MKNIPQFTYRMKAPRKVELVDHDSHWPDLFKKEAKQLEEILGEYVAAIHHIGSTSIPNMIAKPIIDIILECNNLDAIDQIAKNLKHLDYDNMRRQIIPHKSFFIRKQTNAIGFNLHLHEVGSPQIQRHINFRDYLIAHPADAKTYAELKIGLVKKFPNDIDSYAFGKDKLVQELDAKAKLWSSKKFLSPVMDTSAKAWSEEKLVKAMIANLNMHMTFHAQYLNQVDLIRIPGFTIVNSGLQDDTFNYVLDADFSSEEANTKITEVVQYFLQNSVPFSWWISPYDQPADLELHLKNNGFENTENNIAMYLDLDAWDNCVEIPSGLEIIQAKNTKTLQDFALVLTNDEESFKTYFSWIANITSDNDPIEYYVGYVHGKPVVRGLSCYFAQVVGLHWLSTAPDARHRGYARAMQQFRLQRAKERGYHIAVLQASQGGYSLYKKLGYRECGVFKEFKLVK